MHPVTVDIKRLPEAADLPLPTYQTVHAAGMDLCAAVTAEVILTPGARAIIPTGFSIALPPGYEAQIRPRSGLAAKNGVTVLNTPGTIDADYRGEIGVILVNLGREPFAITRGARIAQMIVAPVATVSWRETDTLPETDRGAGGFGSTGVSKT
ncbi:MAG: dUTP diphosphatase [Rhodospirillaceae bacterium]|nr:MAG: dUTP diphosphatase [Rhodospirillaceae bacterium]